MADTWIHFFLVKNLLKKTFNKDEKIQNHKYKKLKCTL